MRLCLELLIYLTLLDISSATCLLNQEQFHILRCVTSVIEGSFARESPLFVSTPTSRPRFYQRALNGDSLSSNEHSLVDAVLEHINQKTCWSLLTVRPDTSIEDDDMSYKYNSYLIFLWSETDGDNVLESLEIQLQNTEDYTNPLNSRGRFIVFVTVTDVQNPQSLARNISELLWNNYRIMNVLIMVRNDHVTQSDTNSQCSYCVIEFYTWFPYESGKCGQVDTVVLLDKWILGENQSTNRALFPEKVPTNLHKCPIKIYANEYEPHIMSECKTEAHGNVTCRLRGAEMEYIYLVGEAMNLTLSFLKLSTKDITGQYLEGIDFVLDGKADVIMGSCPLHPFITAFLEPTVPYIYTAIKWYVPCAGKLPRMGNILGVFDTVVWLAIVIVSIFTAIVFWSTARLSSHSSTNETNAYKFLHNDFYTVWSILLGQSVNKLPVTSKVRYTFFLFVCFCFAMNTVFQTLFISYLVEPGYEKQIESFDEMKDSGILFAKHPSVDSISFLVSDDDIQKVRSPVVICSEYKECMLRLIQKRDVITVTIKSYAEYIDSIAGTHVNGKKSLCSIQENIGSISLAMYLAKGNPLLDKFNVYIRRSLEGGLGQKYMSELAWNGSLSQRSKQEFDNENGDRYFIFTTFHLKIGFSLLLCGYVLSSAVFVCELSSKRFITRSYHHE